MARKKYIAFEYILNSCIFYTKITLLQSNDSGSDSSEDKSTRVNYILYRETTLQLSYLKNKNNIKSTRNKRTIFLMKSQNTFF